MTTNGIETPAAPVSNLRAARREQTQARKTAAKTGTPKLRWQFPSGFAERATTGQTASFDGGELAMKPVDGKWKATFTKGGTETVLAEGVGAAKAYTACVGYVKGQAA